MYESKKVSWKSWSAIKMNLVSKLVDLLEKPRYEHVKAIRIVLNDTFPAVFGYGLLYNAKHSDAYQVVQYIQM